MADSRYLIPDLFLTTISPRFGFSLCGPRRLSGLTAYLLDVKVFVWVNPSSGDRYASASSGRRAAAVFVCHSGSHPTKLGNWRSFVNWNCPVSVGGSVRRLQSEQESATKLASKSGKDTPGGMNQWKAGYQLEEEMMKPETVVRHNCQTGRWVTM